MSVHSSSFKGFCTRTSSFSAIVLVLCLLNFSAAAIDVLVSTQKTNYYVGEDIRVLVTVPTTNSLQFNNLPQTYYTLDNSYVSLAVLLPVLNGRVTPYTWTNPHSWNTYGLGQGPHSVVGTVIGYGNSLPATFEIVPHQHQKEIS